MDETQPGKNQLNQVKNGELVGYLIGAPSSALGEPINQFMLDPQVVNHKLF